MLACPRTCATVQQLQARDAEIYDYQSYLILRPLVSATAGMSGRFSHFPSMYAVGLAEAMTLIDSRVNQRQKGERDDHAVIDLRKLLHVPSIIKLRQVECFSELVVRGLGNGDPWIPQVACPSTFLIRTILMTLASQVRQPPGQQNRRFQRVHRANTYRAGDPRREARAGLTPRGTPWPILASPAIHLPNLAGTIR